MKLITGLFTILFLLTSLPSQACTLKMGYRTTARLPNIEAAPSNKGVYQDLYMEAAKRIGCKLEIHRLPKKRILRDLGRGTLDFYPGLTFTEERAHTIFFFSNGLPSLDVGLTRAGVPTIDSYAQLKGKTVLIAMGAPSADSDQYNLTVKTPPELNIHSAIDYILDGYADFYEDEIGTFAYYLKDHPRANELKYHFNCCGGLVDLTVGFSRASPHMNEEVNLEYNPEKALAYNNFPKKLATRSTAYRFQEALADIKAEGITDKLFEQYYGINVDYILNAKENYTEN